MTASRLVTRAGRAVALLTICIVLILSPHARLGSSPFVILVKAARGTRLFEGRLSGDFAHAPWPSRSAPRMKPGILTAAGDVLTAYPTGSHESLVAQLFL